MKETTRERLLNLFITAWEGGSSYWAEVREDQNAESTFNKIMDEGYTLTVYDLESNDTWEVSKKNFVGSLKKLREEDPDAYGAVYDESYDADTADIWFQLMVMGEVIFG